MSTPSRLSTMTQISTVRRADLAGMDLGDRHGVRGRQPGEGGEHRFEPGVGRLQNLLDLIKDLLLAVRQAHLALRGSTQGEILLGTLAGPGSRRPRRCWAACGPGFIGVAVCRWYLASLMMWRCG